MQYFTPFLTLLCSLTLSSSIFAAELIGHICSVPVSTNELIYPIPHSPDKIEVNECGQIIRGQDAILVENLECTLGELNTNNAAISLYHASLNMNGKTITFKGAQPAGSGIFIDTNSQVYDLTHTAKITHFASGITVAGNKNSIQRITIENAIYGLHINGNHNRIAQVVTRHIGNIIEAQSQLLSITGKGIRLYGDNNELIQNSTQDIGYDGSNAALRVNSMFINVAGVEIEGNNNIIQHHRAENIFANSSAIYNAQSNAQGITISGTNNVIEYSYINKVYAYGFRYLSAGLQTGGMAIGVQVTNPPAAGGSNKVYCSTIQDIYATGKKADGHPANDITAEAYGISAIYHQQFILNNRVTKVDAEALSPPRVAGIRAVDEAHTIMHNLVEYNGEKAATDKTAAQYSLIEGISLDGFNIIVEHNAVKNNFGAGIMASIASASNTIQQNISQDNRGYDYVEKFFTSGTTDCRNNWQHNYLEDATFFPPPCFSQ